MGRRAVLFDVDGTLVDSTYLHTIAWWQALRRAGHDVPMARLHRAIGMGAEQLVPHVLNNSIDNTIGGEIRVDEVSALAAGHDAIYATHWPALRLFTGARDLLQRVHESGHVTVLASSADADEVASVRRLLDADEWIDHATTSADTEHSKPAPDLIEVALRRAGTAATDSLFVGDAVWDVHASTKAGVRCIGLQCGGTSAAELRDAGAVAVYRDPTDLLAHWDTSPLAGTDERSNRVH